MTYSRFQKFWLTEMVRRHEVTEAALDDADILDQARKPKQLQARILKRAVLLAPGLGFDTAMTHWNTLRRWLFMAIGLLAVLAGVGLGSSAIGSEQPVSLLNALIVLLLLNGIMLLVWLISLTRSGGGRGVGGVGLDIGQRLIRNDKTFKASQAMMSLASHHNLLKPVFSVFTHAFWFIIMLAAWATLAVKLGGQAYSFVWSTTILEADTLETLAAVIGWLPAIFGFDFPAVQQLNQYPDTNAHLTAGRWLLVCVAIYGIGVRGALLIGSLAILAARIKRMKLATSEPGIQPLVPKLTDPANEEIVDKDANFTPQRDDNVPQVKGDGLASFSLDYEPNPEWETKHEVVASGTQKKAFLAKQEQAPSRILIARIQSKLSPDRGSLKYLEQLKHVTESLRVWLVSEGEDEPKHLPHWVEALQLRGIHFTDSAETATRWFDEQ